MTSAPHSSADFIELEHRFAAHNYSPLDVVIARGEGAWVEDVEGRRYFDALAGYSALNFGHSNPRLIEVAERQLRTLTLTSRAFHSDQLGPFARDLCALTGKDLILPMNSGAEAVETAIKVTRRWGKRTKGLPEDWGTIIVMGGNFHGRTTTIVSFSTDKVAREDYGPYTPGFLVVPYGDIDALRAAMTDETIGVLLEPIQARAGWSSRRRASCVRCARSAPSATSSWSPTRSSRVSRAPVAPLPAITRTSFPTSTSWARRSVAASSRCRPSPPTGMCSASSPRARTARLSAATPSPRRSAARSRDAADRRVPGARSPPG